MTREVRTTDRKMINTQDKTPEKPLDYRLPFEDGTHDVWIVYVEDKGSNRKLRMKPGKVELKDGKVVSSEAEIEAKNNEPIA